jgi:NAD(P)-dependent dehydrogenase (short-subunit alcohol dehydrogenase family)
MDLGLAGRRVLITGASHGIGRAIAECFSDESADIGVCARRSEPPPSLVAEILKRGTRAFVQAADVAESDQLQRWIETMAEALGGVDIVVSNVSAQSRDWRTSVETDILASVALIEYCLPHLAKSDAPSIVFITSQAGLLGVPTYKSYSAVKAALISYAGSLSRELAPRGIRVNCVSPGVVLFEGGIWDRLRTERPDKFAGALEKSPMGRFCTPAEVARAVVFLASPAASYISGTNLLVDGASREHVQF